MIVGQTVKFVLLQNIYSFDNDFVCARRVSEKDIRLGGFPANICII